MKKALIILSILAFGCESGSVPDSETDTFDDAPPDVSTDTFLDTSEDIFDEEDDVSDALEDVETEDVEEEEAPEFVTRWNCRCDPECGAEDPIPTLIGCDLWNALEWYEVEGRLEAYCPPNFGCHCECRDCTSEIVPAESCPGMIL
jgi:hypothetical protein